MHTYLRRCFVALGAAGVETSLLLKLHTTLNSPQPIHAAHGHYTPVYIGILYHHHLNET